MNWSVSKNKVDLSNSIFTLMKAHTIILTAICLTAAAGCNAVKDIAGPDPVVDPIEKDDRIPIRISSSVTKVADDDFENGDAVGIYVVNGIEDGSGTWQPGSFLTSGNHLDNVKYTLSGTEWKADGDYYWKDSRTQAEFYCYYPRKESVDDLESVAYDIVSDQSSKAAFCGAEILWGKTPLTAPTEESVRIGTTHRMSQIAISVVPGRGYTQETLMADIKSIKIKGLKCGALLNLTNGVLTATGDETDITPYFDGSTYRAMIVPQTVIGKDLISITVGGIERILNQSIEFSSNSRKKCTLTITRINEGINVGIGGWEDDNTDYGGILN